MEWAGHRRVLNMPSPSATFAEQIEELRLVAGDKAVNLIRRKPAPPIEEIDAGWPHNFDAKRALELSFVDDPSFGGIIRTHVEDELGGNFG